MVRRIQAIAVGLMFLAGCSGDTGLVGDAQRAVKGQLRDPESARFSSVRVVETSNTKVVCGLVNAKNGFGGYGGDLRFYYVPQPGTGAIQGDPDAGFTDKFLSYCYPTGPAQSRGLGDGSVD